MRKREGSPVVSFKSFREAEWGNGRRAAKKRQGYLIIRCQNQGDYNEFQVH